MKNKTSKKTTTEYSALGYEVLNQRRTHYVQVPLSVSNQSAPPIRTGSALLDSFVRDRITQAPELQNLHLINVDSRSSQARVASPSHSSQSDAPADHQTARPSAPTRRKIKRVVQKPPAPPAKTPPPENPRSEHPAAEEKPAILEITLREPEPSTPPTPPQVPVKPPAPPSTSAPSTQAPSTQANKQPASQPNNSRPTADRQALDEQALDEQVLEELEAPPVSTKAQPPAVDNQQRTAPATSTGPKPSFAPIVDHEKMARDSEASVGLIDLSDALRFGGDRQELIADEPSILPETEEELGLLTYLSQQISDFTVDHLESGFPNNTDPEVMHRPDPPKHKTVLDIENFRLGELDDIEEEADENLTESALPSQQKIDSEESADIYALSQQVEDLNRKIADLTQKLSQVSNSAD
ncbi:MAG: hypothetical protein ACFB16_22130 [Phormidesmis sp.]